MKMNRRNFFGVAAGGAVSAPVIAKEATQKMGIDGGIGYSNITSEVYGHGSYGSLEWAKSHLKVVSMRSMESRLRDAKSNMRSFNPDIASMKSISPSAAYTIQADRNVVEQIKNDRHYVMRTLEENHVPIPDWLLDFS